MMPHLQDTLRSLVCSILLVLILRFARVYGFVLLSAQFGILLRATIQIHAGNKSGPARHPNTGRNTARNRDNARKSIPRDSNARDSPTSRQPQPQQPSSKQSNNPKPHNGTPYHHFSSPPPYSIVPPTKSDIPTPSPQAILTLYEDIIASDAQTIQVQQETMLSQQETIRSQAQMIRMMRDLLERQDERIEELEGWLGQREDVMERRRGRSL